MNTDLLKINVSLLHTVSQAPVPTLGNEDHGQSPRSAFL